MATLYTPGVYIREIEEPPPRILRVSVPGFTGQSARGPLNSPQLITSWGEFSDIFGEFTSFSYLPYCVFAYFANGGERCYIVRVAHEEAVPATRANSSIRLNAINPGTWGNSVQVRLDPQSGSTMPLATLPRDTASNVTVLHPSTTAGLAAGDRISIVDSDNPFRRALDLPIASVTATAITLVNPLPMSFTAGAQIIGRGFRITARLLESGLLRREEIFDNLSMEPSHDRHFLRIVNGDPVETDYRLRIQKGLSILIEAEDLTTSALQHPRPAAVEESFLEQGADAQLNLPSRYYTGYHTGDYFRLPASTLAQRQANSNRLFGMAAFEPVREVGLLAIPDAVLPDLYTAAQNEIPSTGILFVDWTREQLARTTFPNLEQAQFDMLAQCERTGDRFAILDSPRGASLGGGSLRIDTWPVRFQGLVHSKNAALYYPWVRQRAADFGGRDLLIPPSGHAAGVHARTEIERGPGRAPANEILEGVIDFEFCIGDEQQAILNPIGVNCLRVLPGRGLRSYGARTLTFDSTWRYINVRRVYLWIVKQILANLQWTVFEPNDAVLRSKITARLRLFLSAIFESGALAGATPEEAFFIKCNAENNPPEVVDLGRTIVEIGIAPARPAEFILVTIRRSAEAISISERRA